MWKERRNIVPYYWLSLIIRADAVILGAQNKDGKIMSIFKIERNRP
jgi:hypothetical protein